eukprot:1090509-Rhodomonas_salina.1
MVSGDRMFTKLRMSLNIVPARKHDKQATVRKEGLVGRPLAGAPSCSACTSYTTVSRWISMMPARAMDPRAVCNLVCTLRGPDGTNPSLTFSWQCNQTAIC